jgi:CheY-like chemotaxis protein
MATPGVPKVAPGGPGSAPGTRSGPDDHRPEAGVRATRVVIVDDDELWRVKTAELLADRPGLVVEAAATHDVAAGWVDEWRTVDVAIVDAGDIRRQDDQFPGVGVVRQARRHGRERMVVMVVTGHFLDDALRWRMREAGADYFHHRSDVQDADSLYQAVVHPALDRRGVPDILDPETAFRVGVVRGTRLNAGLDFAVQHDLVHRRNEQRSPRSRQWARWRREFNEVTRLHTVNADGTAPDRDQSDPSYDQIGRFYRWATRAKAT